MTEIEKIIEIKDVFNYKVILKTLKIQKLNKKNTI